MQIIPKLGIDGAEIMCENLIQALKDKGVQVIASDWRYNNAIVLDGK